MQRAPALLTSEDPLLRSSEPSPETAEMSAEKVSCSHTSTFAGFLVVCKDQIANQRNNSATPFVAAKLALSWRKESCYSGEGEWVFASRTAKGAVPRSTGTVAQDHLRPAAVKAGVIPNGYRGRFGWHNLRHSRATSFAANDVNLPAIQSVLRHSRPSTTAIYMHRVNSAQLTAG